MNAGAILLLILGGASSDQAPVTPYRTVTVHGRDQSDPTAQASPGNSPTVHARDQSDATAQGS